MNPLVLSSNRPADRFYRGGARIAGFRGEDAVPEYEPEDWVASTTLVAGEGLKGRTVLPDGRLLADAIADDPRRWLGDPHVAAFGADSKLLVKLLDAGQRLPVHAHPDGAFAASTVGAAHGKAEAWFIVAGGTVHLGLTRDVGAAELAELVTAQRTDELLSLLHEITVAPGDVVSVPPGVLHAIGAGVFMVEIQEPEDLSILLEWDGFALDGAVDGHLGLGFDLALKAVERTGRTTDQVARLVHRHGETSPLLSQEITAYFRLEHRRIRGVGTLDPGYAVIVVLAGDVRIGNVTAAAGTTLLVPAAAGGLRVDGRAQVVIARPPAPPT